MYHKKWLHDFYGVYLDTLYKNYIYIYLKELTVSVELVFNLAGITDKRKQSLKYKLFNFFKIL